MEDRAAMKYLFPSLVLSAFHLAFPVAYADVTIYKEETNTGTPTYISMYGVSGYWAIKATKKSSSSRYRYCSMKPTNGNRSPRTGIFNTIIGPDFSIISDAGRKDRASMTIPGRLRVKTTLKVGNESFDYVRDHFTKITYDVVRKFAQLFIEGSRATWITEGKTASVSLIGFTDAWNYCVDFVGFNPLDTTE